MLPIRSLLTLLEATQEELSAILDSASSVGASCRMESLSFRLSVQCSARFLAERYWKFAASTLGTAATTSAALSRFPTSAQHQLAILMDRQGHALTQTAMESAIASSCVKHPLQRSSHKLIPVRFSSFNIPFICSLRLFNPRLSSAIRVMLLRQTFCGRPGQAASPFPRHTIRRYSRSSARRRSRSESMP